MEIEEAVQGGSMRTADDSKGNCNTGKQNGGNSSGRQYQNC